MDNEQLTSNLGELIKNQIEICEKLDKMSKRIKKIGKAKKEPNYELKGGVFAKGADSKSPFVCAGESIISKKQSDQLTPTQDQKYYLCIKDYCNIKEGTVLKFREFDKLTNCNLYTYKAVCGFPESALFVDISNEPNFIPIQQFETLKEGQEIEFTLRNGKTYKTLVKKDSCDKYTLSLWHKFGNCPYQELNQIQFKTKLLKEYGNSWWLTTNNLEDLTKELNKIITLPDLSKEAKIDENESISMRIKADKLVVSFFDLVNGWQESGLKGEFELKDKTLWNYKPAWKRKAAIMVAIKHCDLMMSELLIDPKFHEWNDLKKELQKMLSE